MQGIGVFDHEYILLASHKVSHMLMTSTVLFGIFLIVTILCCHIDMVAVQEVDMVVVLEVDMVVALEVDMVVALLR